MIHETGEEQDWSRDQRFEEMMFERQFGYKPRRLRNIEEHTDKTEILNQIQRENVESQREINYHE
jgi:hypothetical protein